MIGVRWGLIHNPESVPSRTVRRQGGNEVDNSNGIATSCQRNGCAVLEGRPGGGVSHDDPGKNAWFAQVVFPKLESLDRSLPPAPQIRKK